MPCSNGAWRFLPLPDRAKHKQKKARNYAGLAAFHAIRCLAVPDAESFPLDDHQPHFWRFILNEPKTLDDEPRVVFAGYNLSNDVVAYWDSSSITDINYIHLSEPETPSSIELDSPLVEDLDIDDEDGEDSEVVNQ